MALHQTLQLRTHVVGLHQRTVRQVVLPAPVRRRLVVAAVGLVGVIHVEQRQVVAVRMRELGLRSIRLLLLRVGAHKDVGHRKHGCDGQDLVRALNSGLTISILASCGSSGKSAMISPNGVRLPSSSNAAR